MSFAPLRSGLVQLQEFQAYFTAANLVYLAGALYVAGLAITNQIVLRLFILAGTVIYIIYYAIVAEAPLWPAIYVSILIGVANIGGMTSLIARRSRLAIPKEHADIYEVFPNLPPGDFRALMKLANRYTLAKDTQITQENDVGKKLYFVISGQPLVRKGDQAFVLRSNIFIGEIAFLIGRPSSASAWLEEGAEVLEWDFQALRRRCARNPRFQLALEAAISTDLAGKVAESMGRNSVHVEKIPSPLIEQLAAVRTS
mgnify:FL=1